jgi:hypothetical protein
MFSSRRFTSYIFVRVRVVSHTIPYHTIPYHTIPYHTIPYHTIPYHTIPYNIIPYHNMNHIPLQRKLNQIQLINALRLNVVTTVSAKLSTAVQDVSVRKVVLRNLIPSVVLTISHTATRASCAERLVKR